MSNNERFAAAQARAAAAVSCEKVVLPSGLTVLCRTMPGYSSVHAIYATAFGSIHRQFTLDGKPVTQIVAGERYKVTLHVKNAASRYFVVVEDFIPAGFEIINTSLATESQEQAALLNTDGYSGFERDEKYDDRIAAFADYLPAGEHTYSYLVSASVAGTFAYPSLWASQMYEPAVFGRNATETLVIK